MPQHGAINPNDPNFYWDANFGQWIRKPGSPTGGSNLTLAQALSGVDQTQADQTAHSQLLTALGNSRGGPPLDPPGGGLGVRREGDPGGDPGMPNQPATHTYQELGAGLRLEKNGNVYFKTDPGEIGQLLQQGYQVREGNDPNGQLYTPKSYQGGYLVKSGQYWVPVDTLLNGRMTLDQAKALKQGGYQIDPDTKLPDGSSVIDALNSTTSTTNTTNTTNTTGNQQAAQLSGSLADMLRQLMQQSLDQGAQGQNALSGIIDQLKQNAAYDQTQTEKASAGRDSLVSALLGGSFDSTGKFTANDQGLLGGYNKIIGNIGTGLDPLTMAALNQQAIEGPQRDYQSQVEALKTTLGQRGAYGGGTTPGDLNAIVSGYSPLMTARDTTREGLLQQNAFENQSQKNFNLTSGISALGGLGNTLGTVGGFYNPNTFANTTSNALSNALTGLKNYGDIGFKGIDSAGSLATTLNDTSTGSLGSLLKGALLGTGLNALTTKTSNGKSILGSLIGLIPGFGGGPTGHPDTVSALDNFLSQTVGTNWRDTVNSDIVAYLLSQGGGGNGGGPL